MLRTRRMSSRMTVIRTLMTIITVLIVVCVIFLPMVVSLATKNYSVAENISDEDIIEKINSASSIYLHRNRPSLSESYDVVVDGVKICEINGQFIKMFWNENLEMTSINNNIIYSMEENFGFLRSNWSVFDASGNKLCSLEEKMSLKNDYNIYIGENVIGTLRADWFSIFGSSSIYNSNNETIYMADRDIAGSTTIRRVKESDISNICALMMIIGENCMNDKSNSNSSSSSDGSSSK